MFCLSESRFFSLIGFGLARLEPYQVYYIVRELIPDQMYTTDRAHLKYLEHLRITCKLFQSKIPSWYNQVCFLDNLKSKADGWLHRLALNIAPELPFHTNWQRHHFEFSVEITQHRRAVLWSARAELDGLHIFESPEKAPNAFFELLLFQNIRHGVSAIADDTKRSKVTVTQGTLETIMAMFKGNFSEQLLAIKQEMEENGDNYADGGSWDEDNCDWNSNHGEQLDDPPQDTSKTEQDGAVVIIEDDDVVVVD